MTTGTDLQKQGFQDRIARIQAIHAPEPVTPKKPVKPKRSARKGAARKRDMRVDEQPRKIPKAGILAFGIGMAVMLASNVAAFRASTISGSYFPELLAAIGPFAIAGMLLFVIMIGLGMRDKPHVIGLALGLPLMFFAEPYLASQAPDLWVGMYSADHVDHMLIQAGLRDPMIVSQ